MILTQTGSMREESESVGGLLPFIRSRSRPSTYLLMARLKAGRSPVCA